MRMAIMLRAAAIRSAIVLAGASLQHWRALVTLRRWLLRHFRDGDACLNTSLIGCFIVHNESKARNSLFQNENENQTLRNGKYNL